MCSLHRSSPLEDCDWCQRAVDAQDRVAADHELAQVLWASELTHAHELGSEVWNPTLSEDRLQQHFPSDGTACSSILADSSGAKCNSEATIKGLDQTGEVAVSPSKPFPEALCLWDWDHTHRLSTCRNSTGAGSSGHMCNHEATSKGPEETCDISVVPAASPPAEPLREVRVLAGLARRGDLILESDTCLLPARIIFHDPCFRGVISVQVSETALVSQLLEHLCELLSQPAETAYLLHQGQLLDPKLPLPESGVVLPSSSGRRRGWEIHLVCSMHQSIDPALLQCLLDECPAVTPWLLQAPRCLSGGTEVEHMFEGCCCTRPLAFVQDLAIADDKDSDVSSEWYNVQSLHLSCTWSELGATSRVSDDTRSAQGIEVGVQLDEQWPFGWEVMD